MQRYTLSLPQTFSYHGFPTRTGYLETGTMFNITGYGSATLTSPYPQDLSLSWLPLPRTGYLESGTMLDITGYGSAPLPSPYPKDLSLSWLPLKSRIFIGKQLYNIYSKSVFTIFTVKLLRIFSGTILLKRLDFFPK